MKIGFIGLGSMGLPMAENLLKAGHELAVYNRTKEKTTGLAEKGARVAQTPAEAAEKAEVVFTVLSDDEALKQAVFQERGLLEGLEEGGVHVSVSTISVELAENLSKTHEEKGQQFVSATVLGRPEAAAAAALRVILAGPEQARNRVWPALKAISQEIFVMGEEAHLSNVTKLGNNFLLVSMLEALSEAFLMTEKYGIERSAFLEVASALFGSPVYKNYGTIMAEEAFEPAGFKLKLGLKDVNLARKAAEAVGSPMPLAELAGKHYEAGIDKGWENLDWAALIKCVEAAGGQK